MFVTRLMKIWLIPISMDSPTSKSKYLFVFVALVTFLDFSTRSSSFQDSMILLRVDVQWFILRILADAQNLTSWRRRRGR